MSEGVTAFPPSARVKDGGHLADNVIYFARALRKAGLPVGPGQVRDALEAAQLVGVGPRADFYWALHSVLVRRREHHEVFDQAFRIFWKKRGMLENMMAMLMPSNTPKPEEERKSTANKRVNEALFSGITRPQPKRKPKVELDASGTFSSDEKLRSKDFEQMTAAEIAQAKREIAKLRLALPRITTRRFEARNKGAAIDMRSTMRSSLRGGGAAIALKYRRKRQVIPPLVVLCDVSGSMSEYSRLFLHFLHAMAYDGYRFHAFTFGTRLTSITRELRTKDVDDALRKCSVVVKDWSGGTRISQSIHDFNKHWSRRVLGQGAHVILITDGLERDPDGTLAKEMDRLHRSCRQLIWLNPLLRYDAFEAKAQGIREMLPHVDAFRTIHNLQSMEDLVDALVGGGVGDQMKMSKAS